MEEDTAFFSWCDWAKKTKTGWSVRKQDVCTSSQICFQALEDTDFGKSQVISERGLFLLAILQIPMQVCPFRWGKSDSVAEKSSEKVTIPGHQGSLVRSSVRPVYKGCVLSCTSTPSFPSTHLFSLIRCSIKKKSQKKGPKKSSKKENSPCQHWHEQATLQRNPINGTRTYQKETAQSPEINGSTKFFANSDMFTP